MNREITSNRYVLKLSTPIFIELLLQLLVGNADQVMVGQYSPDSVGAIGNANQIINLLIISFSVVCMASTILISQYIGAGERDKVEKNYSLSIFVNLVFSLFVSLILLFFSPQIYTWMGVPESLMAETCLYTQIIGIGMVLQSLYLTFTAFFRSNALMKQTMLISIVMNLLNIGGNYILINGLWGLPRMGVAGAAISSVVSRLIGLILIIYFFKKCIHVKISWSYLRPFPFGQLKKLLAIGLPSGGESISYNFSQICIQRICNLFENFVINTRVFANMFAMLSYIYGSAIAQASQIVVGYLMGSKRIEDTNRRVMTTLKMAMLIGVAISATLLLLSEPLYGLFTKDSRVVELGRTIMMIELVLELGRAGNMVIIRALQAAGDVNFPIIVGTIELWIVAVGLGYVFSVVLGWGLVGIWIAMAIDECTRAIIFFFRWKSGVWKTKNLVT